jgi:hypothetical protein
MTRNMTHVYLKSMIWFCTYVQNQIGSDLVLSDGYKLSDLELNRVLLQGDPPTKDGFSDDRVGESESGFRHTR